MNRILLKPDLASSTNQCRTITPETRAEIVVNILGITYTNNYGVRVLLSGLLQTLNISSRGFRLRLLDYGYSRAIVKEEVESEKLTLELLNLRYSWKLWLSNNIFRLLFYAALVRFLLPARFRARAISRHPLLKEIAEGDINLSIAGGDSFSDIYGFSRLFYVALPQALVLLLGKPLVQMPQTYGPFKSGLARSIARTLLTSSAAIFSRDEEGANIVSEVVGCPPQAIHVAPDVGFAMSPGDLPSVIIEQIQHWKSSRPIFGVNISKLLWMGGYTGKNMFHLNEDYRALNLQLIENLVSKTDAFVLLVPHVFGGTESGESELVLCRELYASLQSRFPGRIGFVDAELDHKQIKALIGLCDAFAGGRMHACIGAVSMQVPTVPLAYSDKFAGVMRLVDPEIPVMDLRKVSTENVVSACVLTVQNRVAMRERLESRLPGLLAERHRISNMIKCLCANPSRS